MTTTNYVCRVLRIVAMLFIAALTASSAIAASEPALPAVQIDTSWKQPSGRTISVASGQDLQAAINRAAPGDEIILAAGASFRGPIVLPAKRGSAWITIRTSALASLPAGTRVTPASSAHMPAIVAPSAEPAIRFAPGAAHYRVAGIEVTVNGPVTVNHTLVELGSGAETALPQLPSDIILDRVYIHGSPTCNCKRGVSLQGIRQAIVDSYISDIHVVGQEAQAIAAWNGPGPFKIVNNYIEGAGENIMFGGDDPRIAYRAVVQQGTTTSATLSTAANLVAGEQIIFTVKGATGRGSFTTVRSVAGNNITFDAIDAAPDSQSAAYWGVIPSDIQIERNHLRKPLSWKPGAPEYAGKHWSVKNSFELKSAQRVLINGNVFENSWADGQTGGGVLIKSTNQGGGCPWCVTQDVTFTNNIVKGVADSLTINGHESYSEPKAQPPTVSRVKIYNNLFLPASRLFLIYNGSSDVHIEHVTGFGTYNLLMTNHESNVVNPGFVFRNNIVERQTYGVGAGGLEGIPYLSKYFSPYVWDRVVLINTSAGTDQARENDTLARVYPKGTTVVTGYKGVPFIADAELTDERQYRLAVGSKFRSRGSDGHDIGVLFDELVAATAGVVQTPGAPAREKVRAAKSNAPSVK